MSHNSIILFFGGCLIGVFVGFQWGRDTAPTYKADYDLLSKEYHEMLIDANRKIKLANKMLNDSNIIIIHNYYESTESKRP